MFCSGLMDLFDVGYCLGELVVIVMWVVGWLLFGFYFDIIDDVDFVKFCLCVEGDRL